MLSNLRKFMTTFMLVITRGQQAPEVNSTNVEIIKTASPDTEDCKPFCYNSKPKISAELQIEILKNHSEYKGYFSKASSGDHDNYRSSKEVEYVQLCRAVTRKGERPAQVVDVNGKKHSLLNPQSGEFLQHTDTEACEVEHEECTQIANHLTKQAHTRCVTQLFKKGMIALNETTLVPYEVYVPVPSACVCFISYKF